MNIILLHRCATHQSCSCKVNCTEDKKDFNLEYELDCNPERFKSAFYQCVISTHVQFIVLLLSPRQRTEKMQQFSQKAYRDSLGYLCETSATFATTHHKMTVVADLATEIQNLCSGPVREEEICRVISNILSSAASRVGVKVLTNG